MINPWRELTEADGGRRKAARRSGETEGGGAPARARERMFGNVIIGSGGRKEGGRKEGAPL